MDGAERDRVHELVVDVMALESLQPESANCPTFPDFFALDLQLSSPSKIPGMPTRSNGIPNSASASILSG